MLKPLADRFRPQSLDDIVGQKHLLGQGKPLRRIIESGSIPNLIFYGIYLAAKKLPPKFSNAGLVALSLAVGGLGFFLGRKSINLPMFMDTAMTAIPYFCAGHFAFRYTALLKPNKLDKLNIPLAVRPLRTGVSVPKS